MDDITEQQETADEITTALSSGIGTGQEIDEVGFESWFGQMLSDGQVWMAGRLLHVFH